MDFVSESLPGSIPDKKNINNGEITNEDILAFQAPVLRELFHGEERAILAWLSAPGNGELLRSVVTDYLEAGGDPGQVETVVDVLHDKISSDGLMH